MSPGSDAPTGQERHNALLPVIKPRDLEGFFCTAGSMPHCGMSTLALDTPGSVREVHPAGAEVYVLGRFFNQWGGAFIQGLTPTVREAMVNIGLCHYMVAIKQPCGNVVQYDFGPKGGDVGISCDEKGIPAEVRETLLPDGIPEDIPALYVGKTQVTIKSIRDFNSQHPLQYALYSSDCRHYANELVEFLTGTSRSTAKYLKHRTQQNMTRGGQTWMWHTGFCEIAQAVSDIENWNNKGARQNLAKPRLGASAVVSVVTAVRKEMGQKFITAVASVVPCLSAPQLRLTTRLARVISGIVAHRQRMEQAAAASSQMLLATVSQSESTTQPSSNIMSRNHAGPCLDADEWVPVRDGSFAYSPSYAPHLLQDRRPGIQGPYLGPDYTLEPHVAPWSATSQLPTGSLSGVCRPQRHTMYNNIVQISKLQTVSLPRLRSTSAVPRTFL